MPSCKGYFFTATKELEPAIVETTEEHSTVNTDEWGAYNRISETGREHVTVNHGAGEWPAMMTATVYAEVHVNTMECLRNFLRDFRWVSKWYLGQYVAIFEWVYNLKLLIIDFFRILLGTYSAS